MLKNIPLQNIFSYHQYSCEIVCKEIFGNRISKIPIQNQICIWASMHLAHKYLLQYILDLYLVLMFYIEITKKNYVSATTTSNMFFEYILVKHFFLIIKSLKREVSKELFQYNIVLIITKNHHFSCFY